MTEPPPPAGHPSPHKPQSDAQACIQGLRSTCSPEGPPPQFRNRPPLRDERANAGRGRASSCAAAGGGRCRHLGLRRSGPRDGDQEQRGAEQRGRPVREPDSKWVGRAAGGPSPPACPPAPRKAPAAGRRAPHLAAPFLRPLPAPSLRPSCPALQLRRPRPSPRSPTVRPGAPPRARSRAAVITPARAAESRRRSLLRAARVGSSAPPCRPPAVRRPAAPGPLGAPRDEALRSPRGGAARAAGHAGPWVRSALGAAAGAGGCAGESRSVGTGPPAAPLALPPASPRCRRCFPAGTCARRGTSSGLAWELQRPASSRGPGAAGLGGEQR